ncbi:Fur family transcriptional regulator [Stomatohabitans albus]|uniref:Fur family transcriptional regulator n=1 Tax=Stomatohabitans albus TaxID=3110766 RepID=UPI00300DACB6
MSTEHDREMLRANGLRATEPRLAVLAVVRDHQHLMADEVADGVRRRLGSISRQTIYDVLAVLTEAHILRRVIVQGRGSHYEIDADDNHHHVWCWRCGKFEDVSCPVGSAPCLSPSTDTGFRIDVADVVYRGLCPACQDVENNLEKGQ